MRKYDGFTLIELLIVVAIIAILAAIAVPNFLEAQTHSKVTRVMADMRSMGMAFEAYRVDNNSYVSPYFPFKDPGKWGEWFLIIENAHGTSGIGFALTSPVTYLTTIPEDPFSFMSFKRGRPQSWAQGLAKAGALYSASLSGNTANAAVPAQYLDIVKDKGYLLHSPGPNIIFWPHDRDPAIFYDPTNGTVSDGDMWYVGGTGEFGGVGK